MKKKYKVYDVKNFDLKLFLSLVSGSIILTGYKLYEIDKNNSQGEINIIKTQVESTEEEQQINNVSNTTYTYKEVEPKSSDYYRSIEINGQTLNFLNTPTPTPTPNYELIDAYTDDMITGEDGVYPDGWFEYQDRKEHTLNFKTTEEMISFYSKVFEVDENISFNVVNSILGDEDYPLTGEVVINDTTYNSLEEGISKIIRNISNSPSSYGYSENEVRSTEGYQLDYYYPEELIYKFSKVLDVNPYVAGAITIGEVGRNFDSYLFVYNHNPGGIVSNGGFAKYRNEATGIYEYVVLLHDRYYVRSDSGYDRIKIMSNGYCEDPAYWRNLVGSIYFELCNNGYASTFNKRTNGRDFIYCDEEDKSFYLSKYYKH